MKISTFINKLHLRQHINLYRIIVAVGFVIATVLVLVAPLQMPDPDDWAYYNGVRNFSQGDLTISNHQQLLQARDTVQHGGTLLQYLPLEYNKWALEKAPGYVFFLVPFYKMGVPRWGNVILALGMVIVTFILLKQMRGERAEMIGSLLTLFTPIGMVMLNRVYMDTYASLAFVAMGGGLYIYYHLVRNTITPVKGGIVLFLAFFFTGWSVIARYTNLPIAVVLALHLIIMRIIAWRKGQPNKVKREIIPLVLGIGLPAAGLLIYDYFVFGSLLGYSYSFSPYPIKFAFQYIGQLDPFGKSIPLQILQYNTESYARNLLIGFPLLVIGLPGFIAVLCYKFAGFSKRLPPEGKWSSLRSEVSWDILLVLAGWFISVFGLYLGYEWTAGIKDGGGFVIFDRFLLPGLFPIVIICALIIDRFPLFLLIAVTVILAIFGGMLYAQWAWNLHIMPAWLTERTLESRWWGYMFPPWTPYFHPGATGENAWPFPAWSYRYMFPNL